MRIRFVKNRKNKKEKKLYIIVNKRLNNIYACVQGGHAIAKFLLEHPNHEWKNQTLVFLVGDIHKEFLKIKEKNYDYSFFTEPDLDNCMTALAVYCDGEIFKNLHTIK